MTISLAPVDQTKVEIELPGKREHWGKNLQDPAMPGTRRCCWGGTGQGNGEKFCMLTGRVEKTEMWNTQPLWGGEAGCKIKVGLDRWGVWRRGLGGRQETSLACCKLSLQKLQSV